MREAALAVSIVFAFVAWRSSSYWSWKKLPCFSKSRPRHRKRVTFSEEDNTVILISLADELTDEERRAMSYTAAELQEFKRSSLIDEWLQS